MQPVERAKKLFDKAEKLGLYAPTESMVADSISDAEWDVRIELEQENAEFKRILACFEQVSCGEEQLDVEDDTETLSWIWKAIQDLKTRYKLESVCDDNFEWTFRKEQ